MAETDRFGLPAAAAVGGYVAAVDRLLPAKAAALLRRRFARRPSARDRQWLAAAETDCG